MEQSFQTSFIPKKPISTDRVVETHSFSIFLFFSILVIVAVGGIAGGLYLYKNVLVNQQAELSKSLVSSSQSFEQNSIDELSSFNRRTSAAKQVLGSHFALSPFFKILGEITLPSVQFTNFTASSNASNVFSVRMNGLARDYSSVAVQAQVFNGEKGRYFKNVVFSNISLSENILTKGYVTFDISFDIDPSLLSYEKNAMTKIILPQAQPITQVPSPVTQVTEQDTNPAGLKTITPMN